MGPPNQKSMEKGGKRLRVEAPKGPGGASAMKGEGSWGSAGFFKGHEGWVYIRGYGEDRAPGGEWG